MIVVSAASSGPWVGDAAQVMDNERAILVPVVVGCGGDVKSQMKQRVDLCVVLVERRARERKRGRGRMRERMVGKESCNNDNG